MQDSKENHDSSRFSTAEREDEFWRRHGPLAAGHARDLQHKPQKRSSYLALRLTAEELARLRDAAREAGVGPTTLARNLILQGLTEEKGLLQRIEVLEQKVAGLTRPGP